MAQIKKERVSRKDEIPQKGAFSSTLAHAFPSLLMQPGRAERKREIEGFSLKILPSIQIIQIPLAAAI